VRVTELIPRLSIPNGPRDERIMIAGDDVHRARHLGCRQQSERLFGNVVGHVRVIKNISSDEDKLNPVLLGLLAEIHQGRHPCHGKPFGNIVRKTCQAKAQV
jgi:hypothetical protein